ncbi:MAG: FIST C-terminal domain-containing protein [Legionellaceae bacterium]|nr:FIST C-terminal domain-containing protein [Legionellaceae bacterium]
MKLDTFQYVAHGKKKGWSVSAFPDLDSANTLVLIFAAPEYFHCPEPIIELSQYYSQSKIIGCSSAGEIAGRNIQDHSLSVAVIQFEKTLIKTACRTSTSPLNAFDSGKAIASALYDKDLKAIFVLSDGLNINGSELVKGLNTMNGRDILITGGLAGDGSDFKHTWTIYNGEILVDTIVAVGFYGAHIHFGHGSRGGWDIFGPERRITRSKENLLYELDNKPALLLYKEYLGEKASELPASGLLFPLAIRKDPGDPKIVRTILGVDEDKNALIFAGDMPTGYLAQLMRANFDRLISGATDASQLALKQHEAVLEKDVPILLLAVSCVGRRLLLGERAEEEIESTLDIFPAGTKQLGFYSYGEISPFSSGICDLHNQTMTLTSMREEC